MAKRKMSSSYFKDGNVVRKYSGSGSIGIGEELGKHKCQVLIRELRRLEREIDRLRLEVHNGKA